MYLRPDLQPPVTRESVLEAIFQALQERKEIERLTGLRINDDGTIQRTRQS